LIGLLNNITSALRAVYGPIPAASAVITVDGGKIQPLTWSYGIKIGAAGRTSFCGPVASGSYQGLAASLDQLVRDDGALDLARTLPDALDAKLAEEPLRDVLAHVAAAAKDLNRAISYPRSHLGREQLRHGALRAPDSDASHLGIASASFVDRLTTSS
jgi:hypothetical protein